MDTVKAVFGVILLGVAILMLERILPGPVTLMLWALLLIIPAIYMHALDALPPDTSGWLRLWKGVGIAMLIYGIILIIGASTVFKSATLLMRWNCRCSEMYAPLPVVFPAVVMLRSGLRGSRAPVVAPIIRIIP